MTGSAKRVPDSEQKLHSFSLQQGLGGKPVPPKIEGKTQKIGYFFIYVPVCVYVCMCIIEIYIVISMCIFMPSLFLSVYSDNLLI